MDKKKLKFGKRFGFESPEFKVQIDSLDNDLKTDLYNSFLIFIYNQAEKADRYSKVNFITQHKVIWVHFLRNQLDKFPDYDFEFLEHIHGIIYNQVWYKTYELFEFIFNSLDNGLYKMADLIQYVNNMLERNHSAYRVVDNFFVPITNNSEMEEIERSRVNALSAGILGLGEHLTSAVALLSRKPTPDLRNSIKESISMVEAVCRTIEPSQNTLGKALNRIEKKGRLNSALKSSFERLYAFTNDKGGIRHALMDDEALDIEDARYFLVSCSAFANYLVDKGRKEGLLKVR